jgi:hypothetical protein
MVNGNMNAMLETATTEMTCLEERVLYNDIAYGKT